MRKTSIAWFLAALIVVLLGTGLGGYAELSSASPHPPAPGAKFPGALPTPPHSTTTQPPAAAVWTAPPTPAATPAPAPHAAAGPVTAAHPAASSGAARSIPRTNPVYVVRPGDTLWGLAAAHLGNPYRWTELFDLNRGRPQPGTLRLVDPNRIYPGWTLEFPMDTVGLAAPASARVATGAPPAARRILAAATPSGVTPSPAAGQPRGHSSVQAASEEVTP